MKFSVWLGQWVVWFWFFWDWSLHLKYVTLKLCYGRCWLPIIPQLKKNSTTDVTGKSVWRFLLSELKIPLEVAAQCKTLCAGLCKYVLSHWHYPEERTEQNYKAGVSYELQTLTKEETHLQSESCLPLQDSNLSPSDEPKNPSLVPVGPPR